MGNHVYKMVEIVGSSTTGTDDAIRNAVATAASTLRHLDWFEVVQTRGHLRRRQGRALPGATLKGRELAAGGRHGRQPGVAAGRPTFAGTTLDDRRCAPAATTACSRHSPGTPFSVMRAAVDEGDPRAGDQILDRASDTSTSPAPACDGDAGADVDRDAADLRAHHLALAGVHAGADLEAERRDAVARSPRRSGSRAPGRRRRRRSRRPRSRPRGRGSARAARRATP